MTDWNTPIIKEFRESEGRLGGAFEGAPMLILHTWGAKTGAEREHPMMYQRISDDEIAVFGSKAGAPTNPDWYYNLIANPEVEVEIGTKRVRAKARVAVGEERERIWTTQKERYPGFADYERKTSRQIPVVILELIA